MNEEEREVEEEIQRLKDKERLNRKKAELKKLREKVEPGLFGKLGKGLKKL